VPNPELSKADREHESREQPDGPPDGREFGTYASKIGLHFGEFGFRGEFGPAGTGHIASHVHDGDGGRFVEAGIARCGNGGGVSVERCRLLWRANRSGAQRAFDAGLPFTEPTYFPAERFPIGFGLRPERFPVGVRLLPEGVHRNLPCPTVGSGFGPVGGGLSLERGNLRVNPVHTQHDDPGARRHGGDDGHDQRCSLNPCHDVAS